MIHPEPVPCVCHTAGAGRCRVPHVQWLIARVRAGKRYPCQCKRRGSCQALYCPCAGRQDLEGLPGHCCARYNTLTVVQAAMAKRRRETGW